MPNEKGKSMTKKLAIGIAAAALMLAADKQTFTGVITDSDCSKGDHKAMNMGPPDAKCVTECVKGMGGKYVLYDGKEAYTLSDQKNAEKFAAKKVTVSGTLDAKSKTIQVDSMKAAK
jgi:hypothetical protein